MGASSWPGWAALSPETVVVGQAPRRALCISAAKVYMGVKQEIAEMRIPALNAYMKVTMGLCHLGPWRAPGMVASLKGTWRLLSCSNGAPRQSSEAGPGERNRMCSQSSRGCGRSDGEGTRNHTWDREVYARCAQVSVSGVRIPA